MKIKLAGLVADSIVDGPGFRFTIFTQGCPPPCECCHNPQTHDFNGGRYADCDKIIEKIQHNKLTCGVTFSGGEPFCQPEPCAYIAQKLKAMNYHLMAYTGFEFEKLLEMAEKDRHIMDFLNCLDIIIDGKFDIKQRSLELKYKGSANQRTIDVNESIKQGRAVEIEI